MDDSFYCFYATARQNETWQTRKQNVSTVFERNHEAQQIALMKWDTIAVKLALNQIDTYFFSYNLKITAESIEWQIAFAYASIDSMVNWNRGVGNL